MKYFLVVLIGAVVILDNLGSGQGCADCHNTHHHHGRRKRDAATEDRFQQAKDVLQTFDDELIEKLQPDLQYLTPEEKAQFEADLQGVNIAAEVQLASVLSEFGTSLTPKELVKTVVARIMDDFEDKPWLKRIRGFSGKKLENLIEEFIERVDEV